MSTAMRPGAGQQQPQRYLGVTPPIATNGPTQREVEVTESLLAELKKEHVFESDEEAKLR